MIFVHVTIQPLQYALCHYREKKPKKGFEDVGYESTDEPKCNK